MEDKIRGEAKTMRFDCLIRLIIPGPPSFLKNAQFVQGAF